tara:strand:- start:501 stop:1271 length:771 start_codon:yes stop_codon:yes gene_type:complete
MADKIYNPETGRMVSRTGAIGKRILQGKPARPERGRVTTASATTLAFPAPIIVPAPPVAAGVCVMRTTLASPDGKRLPFHGLFVLGHGTGVAIRKGGFIGLYAGRAIFEDDDGNLPAIPKDEHYAFLGDFFVVLPDKEPDGSVSPFFNPIAMTNEPPKGVRANCFFHAWREARHILPGSTSRDPLFAVALHATRDIHAGEELFVNYGKDYRRTHYPKWGREVGPASSLPQRELEPPSAYLALVGKTPADDSVFRWT